MQILTCFFASSICREKTFLSRTKYKLSKKKCCLRWMIGRALCLVHLPGQNIFCPGQYWNCLRQKNCQGLKSPFFAFTSPSKWIILVENEFSRLFQEKISFWMTSESKIWNFNPGQNFCSGQFQVCSGQNLFCLGRWTRHWKFIFSQKYSFLPRPFARTKYFFPGQYWNCLCLVHLLGQYIFCPGQYWNCPGQKFCPGLKSPFFLISEVIQNECFWLKMNF